MSVENSFITKLLSTGEYEVINDEQLKLRYFHGKYRRAVSFIQKHFIKYGKTPSVNTFLDNFPDFTLDNEDNLTEPLTYYAEEVRRKVRHNIIVDFVEEARTFLEEMDSEGAEQSLRKIITKLDTEYSKSDTAFLNNEAQLEFFRQRYLDAGKSGGILGMRTGFEPIDFATKGIQDTDLTAILGYTNVGKSFLLSILACLMYQFSQKKVLFLTKEMSTTQIMLRMHAILARVSYSRLKMGKLTKEEQEVYFKFLDKWKCLKESPITVDLVTEGLTNIISSITKYSPEVVCIDGISLMMDDEGDNDWKAFYNTVGNIKQVCLQKKIPCFMSLQLKEETASLKNVALAKGISQHFDNIFGLEQTPEMYKEKELTLISLKLRDAEKVGKFIINWDFTNMDWSTIVSALPNNVERLPEAEEVTTKKKDPVFNKLQKLKKKTEK